MGKKGSGPSQQGWTLNTTSHAQVCTLCSDRPNGIKERFWMHSPAEAPQILAVGSDIGDGVPSVLLFFDKRRQDSHSSACRH